jgi:membrane protease YdiL (CAAX protease family)
MNPLLITAVLALAVAVVVRRREAFQLRWQPTRSTWAAVGAGLAASAISLLLLLFDSWGPASQAILFGPLYVGCGFLIPWGYALLIERSGVAALGLKRERWAASLAISAVLAALFLPILLSEGDLASIGWDKVARASFVLTGAGGLFELFLYYGFIHLRLDKAFGLIPAILLSSAIYVLWHVGTQLPLEDNPLLALWKLYLVGVMSQSVFSLTRNVLIIWPIFGAVGVMLDFAVNIDGVEAVSSELPWAVGSVTLMVVCAVTTWLMARRRPAGPQTALSAH